MVGRLTAQSWSMGIDLGMHRSFLRNESVKDGNHEFGRSFYSGALVRKALRIFFLYEAGQ
jgi:hypothetical protein